jgi:hypothetical protein
MERDTTNGAEQDRGTYRVCQHEGRYCTDEEYFNASKRDVPGRDIRVGTKPMWWVLLEVMMKMALPKDIICEPPQKTSMGDPSVPSVNRDLCDNEREQRCSGYDDHG